MIRKIVSRAAGGEDLTEAYQKGRKGRERVAIISSHVFVLADEVMGCLKGRVDRGAAPHCIISMYTHCLLRISHFV